MYTNGIYCVLLATNSSKQRKDNPCLTRYRWCLLSVYYDTVTCSQQKLKNFFLYFSSAWWITTFYLIYNACLMT